MEIPKKTNQNALYKKEFIKSLNSQKTHTKFLTGIRNYFQCLGLFGTPTTVLNGPFYYSVFEKQNRIFPKLLPICSRE